MFNQYVWKLYLQSGGNQSVELFQNLLSGHTPDGFAEKIRELHRVYCPDEEILDYEMEQIQEAMKQPDLQGGIWGDIEADDLYTVFSDAGDGEWFSPKETFLEFTNAIAYYTTIHAISYPQLFVPYFFKYNFNVFQTICEEFEIELPKIPAKDDYKGRFCYYISLCKVLKNFQRNHKMSSAELYAFLYDFAPKHIGGVKSYLVDKLPEPKSAFFIGGDVANRFIADNPDTVTLWQCNPDTRVGDMIVMYLRTPISAVCSIWRSHSVGFIDPFFYYYRATFIGNPHSVTPITLDALRKDELLSQMWIVRKNMQGINGVELKPSEYNRIVELSGADVRKLEYEPIGADNEFACEKDVENKLIKPLLKRLGYTERDYVQQIYLEFGNHNHALIPDFTLLPKKKGDHQSAFAVLEAKRSISNQKQLDETKKQVRSYAKLLSAKYQAVISKEKIWLSSADDDFSTDVLVATWNELSDADIFARLYKLLGNRK